MNPPNYTIGKLFSHFAAIVAILDVPNDIHNTCHLKRNGADRALLNSLTVDRANGFIPRLTGVLHKFDSASVALVVKSSTFNGVA